MMFQQNRIMLQKNFRGILNKLREIIFCKKYPIFNIIDINSKKQEVLIRCKGTSNTFKIKIIEAFYDKHLLAGLSSIEASYLGFSYGSNFKKKKRHNINKIFSCFNKIDFFLQKKQGCYKINFMDREGKLSFTNVETNISYVAHPSQIVKNELIISKFDPSQACYIGILAGMSIENRTSIKKFNKPFLCIVNNTNSFQ